jgi:hypothetical protein
MKRLIMLGVAVLFAATGSFWPTEGGAASATYTCTVTQAGPSGTDVKIQLTDSAATPAFSSKWFKVPKGQESRMLAVAMAALINKKKVGATVDPALPSPSEISALFLKP